MRSGLMGARFRVAGSVLALLALFVSAACGARLSSEQREIGVSSAGGEFGSGPVEWTG